MNLEQRIRKLEDAEEQKNQVSVRKNKDPTRSLPALIPDRFFPRDFHLGEAQNISAHKTIILSVLCYPLPEEFLQEGIDNGWCSA